MLYPEQPKQDKNQKENNRAFMEAVYLRYERLILHCLQNHVCDQQVVQDLLQIVVENLYRKTETLKTFDDDHLIAYVITTARHVAYNYNKRCDKENTLFVAGVASRQQTRNTETGSKVETEVVRNEMIRGYQEVFKALSEHDQWLLYGKYILRLSDEELAQKENCKPASIRMKLTRARRAAKELFEKRGMKDLL